MEERIDLIVVEERAKTGGISLAIAVSLVVHVLLLAWFVRAYRPIARASKDVPIARYVDLIQRDPKQFVEAPGKKLDRSDKVPLSAPLSDANRRASTPSPTGEQPTTRPGDGSGLFTPPSSPGPRGGRPRPAMPPSPAQRQQQSGSASDAQADAQQRADVSGMVYRQSQPAPSTGARQGVDWNSALREAARATPAGGTGGLDTGKIGGEQGFAEQGPLSFETQWYDWGDYAQSMVSRIRVNWYGNIPQIIRTGLKGVATIRFTIHRDGRISDVTIVESSGVPPYDYAARKAIELSSPLNPLPKDFPNPTERVTCMFYYNMQIPQR